MANRFYASRAGQIVTVTPAGEPTPAVRTSGRVSAVDFNFDVTINLGEAERVRVAVATEVLTDLWPWSQKPESLEVIGSGGSANELATDLCIARILEAIDRGVNFDQDFNSFPDSFLLIKGTPEPIAKIATIERTTPSGITSRGDAPTPVDGPIDVFVSEFQALAWSRSPPALGTSSLARSTGLAG